MIESLTEKKARQDDAMAAPAKPRWKAGSRDPQAEKSAKALVVLTLLIVTSIALYEFNSQTHDTTQPPQTTTQHAAVAR